MYDAFMCFKNLFSVFLTRLFGSLCRPKHHSLDRVSANTLFFPLICSSSMWGVIACISCDQLFIHFVIFCYWVHEFPEEGMVTLDHYMCFLEVKYHFLKRHVNSISLFSESASILLTALESSALISDLVWYFNFGSVVFCLFWILYENSTPRVLTAVCTKVIFIWVWVNKIGLVVITCFM